MQKSRMKLLALGILLSAYYDNGFATTTVSFYAKDQHGSIAAITDVKGSLTNAALTQYNDYGMNQSNSHTSGQISINYDPYQYSGEYTDNESGLQPLGNGYRYYNPSLMRFISPDSYPLLNLYAYGSGNPIGNVDPTGHMSQGLSAVLGMEGAAIGDIGAGVGLGLAIMTLDPIAMLGAALGLFSAATGGASTAISLINHQEGKSEASTAEKVLNGLSIGLAIGSAGIDVVSVAAGFSKVASGNSIVSAGLLDGAPSKVDQLTGPSQENVAITELTGDKDSETSLVAKIQRLPPELQDHIFSFLLSKTERNFLTPVRYDATEDRGVSYFIEYFKNRINKNDLGVESSFIQAYDTYNPRGTFANKVRARILREFYAEDRRNFTYSSESLSILYSVIDARAANENVSSSVLYGILYHLHYIHSS